MAMPRVRLGICRRRCLVSERSTRESGDAQGCGWARPSPSGIRSGGRATLAVHAAEAILLGTGQVAVCRQRSGSLKPSGRAWRKGWLQKERFLAWERRRDREKDVTKDGSYTTRELVARSRRSFDWIHAGMSLWTTPPSRIDRCWSLVGQGVSALLLPGDSIRRRFSRYHSGRRSLPAKSRTASRLAEVSSPARARTRQRSIWIWQLR